MHGGYFYSMNVSTLNYTQKAFETFGQCVKKIKIDVIEEHFASVGNLDSFVEDIIEKSLKLDGQNNVDFHFFQNAVSKNKEETNIESEWNKKQASFKEKIFELDTSLRIINIQNIQPILRDICLKLSNCFQMPIYCTLYLSPNESINCLGKHKDIEEIFIYQLIGKKEWKIFLNSSIEKFRSIILEPRETLYLPSRTIHKAECLRNIPSVHLNFAFPVSSIDQFWNYLFNKIKEEIKKDKDIDLPYFINNQTISSICEHFTTNVSSIDPNYLAQEYKRHDFIQSINIMKKGKKY